MQRRERQLSRRFRVFYSSRDDQKSLTLPDLRGEGGGGGEVSSTPKGFP